MHEQVQHIDTDIPTETAENHPTATQIFIKSPKLTECPVASTSGITLIREDIRQFKKDKPKKT